MRRIILALALAVVSGCARGEQGRTACGIAALAGPTLLLSEFTTPGQTLSHPPARLPERVVARFVAGGAYPAIVGRTDTLLVVGVEGSLPAGVTPGFGVLVVDPADRVRGVMLFEGAPIRNAPQLGTVSVGKAVVPLLGIQLDPGKYEDPGCPFFPDSILQ
ncbi:MAG: hypothetical protein ACOY71_01480 [Gemmatimonadota bacterium]